MALPKTRISRARGRKRRTHYKAGHVTIMTCPQCSQKKCRTALVQIAVITVVDQLFRLLTKNI